VAPIAVASHRRLALDEPVAVAPAAGCLALDGEREIERRPGQGATVRLVEGPFRIDVDAVMSQFATHL
jgi:hypothetical protein